MSPTMHIYLLYINIKHGKTMWNIVDSDDCYDHHLEQQLSISVFLSTLHIMERF